MKHKKENGMRGLTCKPLNFWCARAIRTPYPLVPRIGRLELFFNYQQPATPAHFIYSLTKPCKWGRQPHQVTIWLRQFVMLVFTFSRPCLRCMQHAQNNDMLDSRLDAIDHNKIRVRNHKLASPLFPSRPSDFRMNR